MSLDVVADDAAFGEVAQILYQDLNTSRDPFPIRAPVDRTLKTANTICANLDIDGITGIKLLSYLESKGLLQRDRKEYIISG